MIINTPSGYVVHLKDELSFGERRTIERYVAKEIMASGDKNISAVVAYDVEDMVCGILITKIVKNEQEVTTDFVKEMGNWKEEDAKVVYDATGKIYSRDSQKEKKTTFD